MSLRAPRRIAALLAVPALLGTGVAVAAPGADAATSDPTYKGSALALSVKVGLAGSSVLDEVLPELVTYPPGAKKTLIELPAELAELVSLKVLNASSDVSDGKLASNAHTTSLGVLGEVITAKVLNADCSANQGDVEGDSQVAGLTLAGSKVPVDPGPNVKIEIPDALAALVKGSIVIDEQTETKDGGIQIRALHINLVVAPTAVDDALNSVIRTVRETAQQLKVVIEEVTGKSLDELVGAVDKAEKQKRAQAKKGAQSADQAEVRASAAKQASAQAPAEAAAPAQPAAPAEAAAPATETEKSDGADLDSEAAADEQTEADQQADTEAAVAAESEEAAQDAASEEAAQAPEDAAAAERAERAEKGTKAEQAAEATAPQSTDPAVASQGAPAAPAPAPAKPKAEGSDVPVLDKVQSAIPAADSIAGALGVDIIVSQVTCEGAPGVVQTAELPGTGGNGNAARDIAVTGLGLLVAGGAAVVVTRRRRSHTLA
jgi:hypothetical protein